MTVTVAPRRTAVVTGASSGIGREMARGLARRGYDLLLVARRQDRLDTLREELERGHRVRVRVRALDLSEPAAIDLLLAEIDEGRAALEVFVNNAGFGVVGEFVATDLEAEERMIRLHVLSAVRLTKTIARHLVARGSGYILNVASTAGFKPGPLGVVYAATKAFVVSFSEGLENELRDSGVVVTTFCPGPVRTEFDAVAVGAKAGPHASARAMDAADVAERGLAALFDGKSVVIPGASNRLHVLASRFLPRRAMAWLTRTIRARRRTRAQRRAAGAQSTADDESVPLTAIPFAGLTLFTGGFEQTASWIAAEAGSRRSMPRIVAHVNANNYHRIFHGPGVGRSLDGRYVLLFDGIGMKLAGWVMQGTWHRDLNGTDLFPILMQQSVARGLRLFFLGGTQPIVEEAVRRAQAQHPGLRVAGLHPGYFEANEQAAVVAKIRQSRADLLVLARGSGLQRDFLLPNLAELGVSVVWNAGGLFNFVSGQVPRAPQVVRALRLEWLFRLAREPERMWHRNIVVGPWLLALALRERFAARRPVEVVSWEQSRLEE